MQYRQKMLVTFVLTIMITAIVAVATENARGYVFFTWNIEEGDQFLFEVSVVGYTKTGSVIRPPTQTILNNTIILIEIVSLPFNTIILDGETFAEHIIEYRKTSTTFENGTEIPAGLYYEVNTLASRGFYPRGPYEWVDSFYPDQIEQLVNTTVSSFVSSMLENGLVNVGYASLSADQSSGWYCKFSPITGIPVVMTLWAWSLESLHEFAYNVTLTFLE